MTRAHNRSEYRANVPDRAGVARLVPFRTRDEVLAAPVFFQRPERARIPEMHVAPFFGIALAQPHHHDQQDEYVPRTSHKLRIWSLEITDKCVADPKFRIY